MVKIIAQAFPHGVTSGGLTESLTEVTATDEIPADACGEAVNECIHKAFERGFDPTGPDFNVIVTFKRW